MRLQRQLLVHSAACMIAYDKMRANDGKNCADRARRQQKADEKKALHERDNTSIRNEFLALIEHKIEAAA